MKKPIKHKSNLRKVNPLVDSTSPYSLLFDKPSNDVKIINGFHRNSSINSIQYKKTSWNNSEKKFAMTAPEKELFQKLTEYKKDLPNVGKFKKGELFIHWLYPDRTIDKLYPCEMFHLNMLRYFGIPKGMSKIHIRCACSYKSITNAMKQAIELLGGNIDFKLVPNKQNWEHDTIQEATEYALSTGKFIYYTHFKGSSRMAPKKDDRRNPICTYIDVLYWCYLMYRGLFTEQPFDVTAIGPIAYYGINDEYIKLNHPYMNPRYQYIGSFQAFDGVRLKERFEKIGLDSVENRNKYIWNVSTGRYAVEMFLCLAFEESQVHSLVQLPKKKAAYRMYRDNFCKHLIEEFRNPYQTLKSIYNRKQNVAICCVAKNEDLYADEWLNHYRRFGVSHFYWIDNNDTKTAKIKEISTCKDVTVIDANGIDKLKDMGYQQGAYQLVYNKYGKEYVWIGFLDLDEFVEIDNGMSLVELLNQPMFYGTTSVSMHWRYFGDNGLVKYDERPLCERFKEPAPIDVKYASKEDENRYVKSFVRTELPIECGIHTSKFYGSLNKLANGKLREPYEDVASVDVSVARVNHYGTKTIEEYINRKCFNTSRATGQKQINNKDRLDWFFNVNEVTDEKLKVIKEMLPNLKYKR